MTASRWNGLRRIYRWSGMTIGIFLILVECLDAMVTPRPDWLWFVAALWLIFLCRPRKSAISHATPEDAIPNA